MVFQNAVLRIWCNRFSHRIMRMWNYIPSFFLCYQDVGQGPTLTGIPPTSFPNHHLWKNNFLAFPVYRNISFILLETSTVIDITLIILISITFNCVFVEWVVASMQISRACTKERVWVKSSNKSSCISIWLFWCTRTAYNFYNRWWCNWNILWCCNWYQYPGYRIFLSIQTDQGPYLEDGMTWLTAK